MTEPDRIWINDKWEAYLRPTFDGDTSGYVRADLANPAAIREGDYFEGIEEGIKIGREAALREAADQMAVISLHNPPRTAEIIKACGRSILALIPKGATNNDE